MIPTPYDACMPAIHACVQVVSEYRKARAIMADVTAKDATEGTAQDQGLAEGTTKSVWHSIYLEVDKVSSQLPHDLLNMILETANHQDLRSFC